MPPSAVDIVSAIGLLCPMPTSLCVKVVKNLSKYLRSGGLIIYSTAQDRMQEDALCDYIMRLFGWHMDHKTDQTAWDISVRAGLIPLYQFFEQPNRHHCMTVARKI